MMFKMNVFVLIKWFWEMDGERIYTKNKITKQNNKKKNAIMLTQNECFTIFGNAL